MNEKHPTTELRYYELPEQEPALTLQGEEWVRCYGSAGSNALHFHNLMEIGYCRAGTGKMILEDRVYSYGPGTMTIIPGSCHHTTLSGGQLSEWSYLFIEPLQILKRAFPEAPLVADQSYQVLHTHAVCMKPEQAAAFVPLFEQVLAEYREKKSCHLEMVYSLLTSLLILAVRRLEHDAPLTSPSVLRMQQIMPAVEHITFCYMEAVTIADLAQLCSMSEAHLRRKFQEYLHMSPLEMLTTARIRNGCQLLNTTTDSVPEVAAKVGYQSVSSFERNFQKLLGLSPYQYRKKSSQLEGQILKYNISAKHGW